MDWGIFSQDLCFEGCEGAVGVDGLGWHGSWTGGLAVDLGLSQLISLSMFGLGDLWVPPYNPT